MTFYSTNILPSDRTGKEGKFTIFNMQALSDSQLDSEYEEFMKKTFSDFENFRRFFNNPLDIDGVKRFFEFRSKETASSPTVFLPGKHAEPLENFGFWWHNTNMDVSIFSKHGQGWKIHVTAQPKSAKKIAELILPILNNVLGLKTDFVSYKIIASIPLMRTLWEAKKFNGSETQAGKFLVIYPNDTFHAYNLVKKIDEVLLDAKRRGELDDSDFLPLVGDAKVGYSNGVYVRFGLFFDDAEGIKKVNSLDQTLPPPATVTSAESTMKEPYNLYEDDNRFRPWPDFMNKGNSAWQNVTSPFGNLPITWSDYHNPHFKITSWENRPYSWKTPDQIDQRQPQSSFMFHGKGDQLRSAHRKLTIEEQPPKDKAPQLEDLKRAVQQLDEEESQKDIQQKMEQLDTLVLDAIGASEERAPKEPQDYTMFPGKGDPLRSAHRKLRVVPSPSSQP